MKKDVTLKDTTSAGFPKWMSATGVLASDRTPSHPKQVSAVNVEAPNSNFKNPCLTENNTSNLAQPILDLLHTHKGMDTFEIHIKEIDHDLQKSKLPRGENHVHDTLTGSSFSQNNPLTTQITPQPKISSHILDFAPFNSLKPTQPKISPQKPHSTPPPIKNPEKPFDIPIPNKLPNNTHPPITWKRIPRI